MFSFEIMISENKKTTVFWPAVALFGVPTLNITPFTRRRNSVLYRLMRDLKATLSHILLAHLLLLEGGMYFTALSPIKISFLFVFAPN